MTPTRRTKAGRKAEPTDAAECPDCGASMSRHGLKIHLSRVHGLSKADAVAAAESAQSARADPGFVDLESAVRRFIDAQRDLESAKGLGRKLPAAAVRAFTDGAKRRMERAKADVARALEG